MFVVRDPWVVVREGAAPMNLESFACIVIRCSLFILRDGGRLEIKKRLSYGAKQKQGLCGPAFCHLYILISSSSAFVDGDMIFPGHFADFFFFYIK